MKHPYTSLSPALNWSIALHEVHQMIVTHLNGLIWISSPSTLAKVSLCILCDINSDPARQQWNRYCLNQTPTLYLIQNFQTKSAPQLPSPPVGQISTMRMSMQTFSATWNVVPWMGTLFSSLPNSRGYRHYYDCIATMFNPSYPLRHKAVCYNPHTKHKMTP